MSKWQVGDYLPLTFNNGAKGWARLDYEVTGADVPLANGAQPGDFLWRQVGDYHHGLRGEPMTLANLVEERRIPQDRLLWLSLAYGRQRMVVLGDAEYLALHAMLRLHERAMQSLSGARKFAADQQADADAAHARRQAAKAAAKRLGGPDQTNDRRTTHAEVEANARLDTAKTHVRTMRYEIGQYLLRCAGLECDRGAWTEVGCAWHALSYSPYWNSYQIQGAYDQTAAEHEAWVEACADAARLTREEGLKEALKPPKPPRARCSCCGQLEPDPDEIFIGADA